jgi:hypothetical protein
MSQVRVGTFKTAFLAALRAWPVEPLASAVVRVGPCHSLRLTTGQTALVIVTWLGMPAGETSAGSGNNWKRRYQYEVLLAVPDNEDDPDAADDALINLFDEFEDFMHDIGTRSLAGIRVGHITAAPVVIVPLFENTEQLFRCVVCDVSYETLKGA